jgi:hypothetical protein
MEDPRTVENPLRFDIPSAAVGRLAARLAACAGLAGPLFGGAWRRPT